jgi:hypothetical protein
MTTQIEDIIERLQQQVSAFQLEATKRQADGLPEGYPAVSTYQLIEALVAVQADMRELTQPHKEGDHRE